MLRMKVRFGFSRVPHRGRCTYSRYDPLQEDHDQKDQFPIDLLDAIQNQDQGVDSHQPESHCK